MHRIPSAWSGPDGPAMAGAAQGVAPGAMLGVGRKGARGEGTWRLAVLVGGALR